MRNFPERRLSGSAGAPSTDQHWRSPERLILAESSPTGYGRLRSRRDIEPAGQWPASERRKGRKAELTISAPAGLLRVLGFLSGWAPPEVIACGRTFNQGHGDRREHAGSPVLQARTRVWRRVFGVSNFTFLHAADIHLDSPLHGLSRYEGVPVDQVRGATRAAFDNLIGFAIDEHVDFVVLAGDLFDGDWRDMGTGLYFARAMGRLAQSEIRAFVLRGNHDAASVLSSTLPWPENVHVFSARRAETIHVQELGVALHGRSFANAHVTENLAAEYPDPIPSAFNIGVLHTALAGHTNHAPYAPCSVAQLQAKGYDYWALGHVHDFSIESEQPPIVFPGNLQGRNIRETGAKGAVIVHVRDGIATIRQQELDVLRWASVEVGCSGVLDLDGVHQKARAALSAAYVANDVARPLIVRVVLSGEAECAGALQDRGAQLRDEIRSIATAISPELWVEKVIVRAVPPQQSEVPEGVEDIATILAGASTDADLSDRLRDEFGQFLTSTIAPETGEETALSASARLGNWPPLIEAARSALMARLKGAD